MDEILQVSLSYYYRLPLVDLLVTVGLFLCGLAAPMLTLLAVEVVLLLLLAAAGFELEVSTGFVLISSEGLAAPKAFNSFLRSATV